MATTRHWLLLGAAIAAASCILDRGGRLEVSGPDPTGGSGGEASCTTDADCEARSCRTVSCEEGACVTTPEAPGTSCGDGRVCDVAAVCKKPPGEACANGDECHDDFCVDGVCCLEACEGTCSSCVASGPGECTVFAAGLDPDDECQGPRFCDGADRCALGEHQWSSAFESTDDTDGAAVTVDPEGNVIVALHFTGTITIGADSYTASTFDDAVLIKLDADGAVVFTRHIGGIGYQLVSALACDESGNIFVAGRFSSEIDILGTVYTTAGDYDAMLFMLNAAGDYQWSEQMGGAYDNRATDVAVTPDGDVVVVGTFDGPHTINGNTENPSAIYDSEVWAAKYTAGATPVWTAFYVAPGDDTAASVDVAPDGRVIIGGDFSQGFDADVSTAMADGVDAFVAILDANGETQSIETHGGTGSQRVTSVTALSDGLAIGGTFDGYADLGGDQLPFSGPTDSFVAVFASDGSHVFSSSLGANGQQRLLTLASDENDNLLLGGYFVDELSIGGVTLTPVLYRDPFLAKLSKTGALLWLYGYGAGDDEAVAQAADGLDGSVLAVGSFGSAPIDLGGEDLVGAGLYDHAFVVKLSP